MVGSTQFWDRHARGYAKRPVADEPSYLKKLALTQARLEPHMEVLEFGCGTGSTAIAHAPFVSHIKAVDLSGKMIEIAQAKAVAAGVENVIFEQSGIDDLNEAEATYDVVMGHSILHLVDDRKAVIEKVYKLLKPGGIFVTSTTCLAGTLPILKAVLPIGSFLGLLPPVKFFTVEDLRQSMTDSGFRIDDHWQPGKDQAVFIIAKKM